MVDKKEVFKEYGVKVSDIEEMKEIDGNNRSSKT